MLVIVLGFIFIEMGSNTTKWINFGVHGPGVKASLIGKPLGIFLILWGIYFFYKIAATKTIEIIGYKCISCGKVFELEKDSDNSCKDCNNPLEELDGFFERHPEFKEKDIK
jgi:hypothetical protein